jgi:hypothetical protein
MCSEIRNSFALILVEIRGARGERAAGNLASVVLLTGQTEWVAVIYSVC